MATTGPMQFPWQSMEIFEADFTKQYIQHNRKNMLI